MFYFVKTLRVILRPKERRFTGFIAYLPAESANLPFHLTDYHSAKPFAVGQYRAAVYICHDSHTSYAIQSIRDTALQVS